MANLDHVKPSVATRVRWMTVKAAEQGVTFTVTTGQRGKAEQERLWKPWEAALIAVGCKNPRNPTDKQRRAAQANGAIVAAYPGTSNHGRILNGIVQEATAVDLACNYEDNHLRDSLAQQAGLHQPVEGEKWHLEEKTNPGPVPVIVIPNLKPMVQAANTELSEEDEDDMNRPVSEINWPNGGKTQVFADGIVKARGPIYAPLPFFGDMGNLPAERKTVFEYATGIVAVDLNNPEKGYTVWDQADHAFTFDAGEYENIKEYNQTGRWPV